MAAGAPARSRALRAFLRRPVAVAGAVIVICWVVAAVGAPWLTPHDPLATNPLGALAPPGAGHLLGTDSLGRDVLSRVLAGSRSVLVVAPLATLLGLAVGVPLGALAGYSAGVADEVVMRLCDAVLAFPIMIVAVLVLGLVGPSTPAVILVIGLIFGPVVARTARAAVLAEKDAEYVAAARLRGERRGYILAAEILPNITAPLLVEATVRLGAAVMASASLSFLGLGVQPPVPDWGLSIGAEWGYLQTAWWSALFPCLALASLVTGVVLLAEGIRRA